jgi:hypothetical protein
MKRIILSFLVFVELSSCTNEPETFGPSTVLQVYPSPAIERAFIQVNVNGNEPAYVKMTDPGGKILLDWSGNSSANLTVDLKDKSSGKYYVFYQSGAVKLTKTVIKL